MGQENEIVFEDLHGVQETTPMTVDIDADMNDDGITRTPASQAADERAEDDDVEGRTDDDADEKSALTSVEDDDASSDGEDGAYSKKVKARIERERRAKKKAQDESDYWKDQAQRLAKDTTARDRKDLERSIERATAGIESTQADLERAIEEGNTKDQVRLTSQLTDLKAEKIRSEVGLSDLPEDGNVPPFDGKVAPASQPTKSLADEWVDGKDDWYGARGFERQTRLANRLDKDVYKDGFDPTTPEYFEELDKRLRKQAPELFEDPESKQDDSETSGNRRRSKQSPVAGVDSADNRRAQGKGSKVQLNEADFENMRRFNLNVNDPEVLKEYARNKGEGVKR